MQELSVTVKTKELCSYVFKITEGSPKKYRLTIVNKMQNLSLLVIELIYMANEIYISSEQTAVQRLQIQRKAIVQLKLLGFIAEMAYQRNCILQKQYEHIAKLVYDSCNMMGGWMNADRKRTKGTNI